MMSSARHTGLTANSCLNLVAMGLWRGLFGWESDEMQGPRLHPPQAALLLSEALLLPIYAGPASPPVLETTSELLTRIYFIVEQNRTGEPLSCSHL